ncbi:hypothetical protein TWF281_009719 [Arthrobotrys megalospora]
MSLPKLPCEVIDAIFENLGFHDLFGLLLTCKDINPIAHRHLWSVLEFGRYEQGDGIDSDSDDGHTPTADEEYDDRRHYLGPTAWQCLARMHADSLSGELKADLGWRHTRKIAMFAPSLLNEPKVAQMLIETLKSGDLKPRQFELHLNPYHQMGLSGGKYMQLLLTLKSYFQSNEGSIILDANEKIFPMLHLLETKSITELDLDFQPGDPVRRHTAGGITSLTDLFTSTPNLKHLFIGHSFHGGYCQPWPIGEQSILLAKLQVAFQKLTKLEKFRVSGGGFFIHPSFFLTPPVNVRVLEYECVTTPLWWLGLSKAVLPQLEELTIGDNAAHLGWRDLELERSRGIKFKRQQFLIGSIAITSLKRISGQPPASGPIDWFPVVLDANKGIDGNAMAPLLSTAIEADLNKYTDILIRRIRRYRIRTAQDYGRRWGEGVRGDRLEKTFLRECVEALALEMDSDFEGQGRDGPAWAAQLSVTEDKHLLLNN